MRMLIVIRNMTLVRHIPEIRIPNNIIRITLSTEMHMHILMILGYDLGIDWMKSNLNYSNNNEYAAYISRLNNFGMVPKENKELMMR